MATLSFRGRPWPKAVHLIPLLLAAILVFALTPGVRASGASAPVAKVLVGDGDVQEISNAGTVQAVNAIFGSDDMPADAKVQAVTSALRGAALRGRLVPTTLTSGDEFFALDDKTGALVVVTYSGSEFGLPGGGTSFTHLFIPTG